MAMATDIGQRLDAAARALAESHAIFLQEVAELDRAEAWRAEGYGSMDQWLVARYGFGRHTAIAYTRTSAQLVYTPAIARMLASGQISFDQARAVMRLNATDVAKLPVAIRRKTADQIQRLARRQERLDIDDAVRAHRWRHLTWNWSNDAHVLHLRGELPHDQGAALIKSIDRLVRTMPPNAEDGVYDSYEAYAADALHQLASMHLGRDGDPDRAAVVVHVEADRLSSADGVGEDGPSLAIEAVRRIACDSRLEVVVEAEGATVGIGRASRKIPAWMGRRLRQRDQGCRFLGCERTRWVHIHHLVHWSQGGRTDLDNLVTLCPYHHRLVHDYGWTISGDPNHDIEFIRPGGQLFRYPDPSIVDPVDRAFRRNPPRGPWIPTPGPDT